MRRWWQWCLVGLANPEECDSKLGIGGHAFEKCVAEFEEFLPVREFLVQEYDAAGDDRVAEETETDAEGYAFHKHVGGYEEGNEEERGDDCCESKAVSILWEWGSRG